MLPNPIFAFVSLALIASVVFATWHGAWMLIQVFGR